jgi:chorismate lyase/3-hydroxybenzoate synthase
VTEPINGLTVGFSPQSEGEAAVGALGERLAVVRYGFPAPDPIPGVLTVSVPMPQFGQPTDEVWRTSLGVTRGEEGAVAFAATDRFMFGVLTLAQSPGEPLEAGSRTAYRTILAFLRDRGYPHPVRMWNYLPRINADEEGMERYQRFCVGRAEGFEAIVGESETGAFPSATAVGSMADDTLSVHFLAGRASPGHVESPRQVSAYRYPRRYGPQSPSFSRATLFEHGVYVAGTASITGAESRHEGDPVEQFKETLVNIDALVKRTGGVEAAGLYKIYLRRPEDYPAVRALFEIARPKREAQYLQADICRSELLLEVELICPVG